jgi:hypothetical protein
MAYRIVPIRTNSPEEGEFGMIDPVVMYDNMMNNFGWGNAGDPSVYLDENNRRMFSNFRRLFGRLAGTLIEKGDTTRAVEVAHRGIELIPFEKIPNDFFNLWSAEVLIRAGLIEEGEKLVDEITSYATGYLDFASKLESNRRFGLDYLTGINMQTLIDIYRMSIRLNMNSLTEKIEPVLNNYYSELYSGSR